MAGRDESRMSRWSRLKRKRAAGETVVEPAATDSGPVRGGAAAPAAGEVELRDGKPWLPPLAPDGDEDDGAVAAAAPADTGEAEGDRDGERPLTPEEEEAVAALPPIDELTAKSDFSPFLSDKIPDFIQRRALRRLWRSDPAFAFLDGMAEYDEDYSVITELAADASAYRPGNGYFSKDGAATEEESATRAEQVGESAEATSDQRDLRPPDSNHLHEVYRAPTAPARNPEDEPAAWDARIAGGDPVADDDEDDDLGDAEDDIA